MRRVFQDLINLFRFSILSIVCLCLILGSSKSFAVSLAQCTATEDDPDRNGYATNSRNWIKGGLPITRDPEVIQPWLVGELASDYLNAATLAASGGVPNEYYDEETEAEYLPVPSTIPFGFLEPVAVVPSQGYTRAVNRYEAGEDGYVSGDAYKLLTNFSTAINLPENRLDWLAPRKIVDELVYVIESVPNWGCTLKTHDRPPTSVSDRCQSNFWLDQYFQHGHY